MPSSKIVTAALDEAQFVVSSSLQNNTYQYFFGTNILENHDLNQNRSRLYDDGQFEVYGKTPLSPMIK